MSVWDTPAPAFGEVPAWPGVTDAFDTAAARFFVEAANAALVWPEVGFSAHPDNLGGLATPAPQTLFDVAIPWPKPPHHTSGTVGVGITVGQRSGTANTSGIQFRARSSAGIGEWASVGASVFGPNTCLMKVPLLPGPMDTLQVEYKGPAENLSLGSWRINRDENGVNRSIKKRSLWGTTRQTNIPTGLSYQIRSGHTSSGYLTLNVLPYFGAHLQAGSVSLDLLPQFLASNNGLYAPAFRDITLDIQPSQEIDDDTLEALQADSYNTWTLTFPQAYKLVKVTDIYCGSRG